MDVSLQFLAKLRFRFFLFSIPKSVQNYDFRINFRKSALLLTTDPVFLREHILPRVKCFSYIFLDHNEAHEIL